MSILELTNVSKSFGGVKAVSQLNMGFEKGEITALIGPNGAGKTTVFNLISGYLKPDEGSISYKGKEISDLPPWQITEAGIGRLFQDVRLFQRMTVLDNIMAGFKNQMGENPLRALFNRKKVNKQEHQLKEKAIELLSFVGLLEKSGELAENLSYGQQKLVSIARLLAADAEVLLLDEPTAGVNPQMVDKLLEVINNLIKEGKTIIIIEHNMNVIIEIAHWVDFMDEGKLISFGLPEEVLGDPEVRAAYIGI